MGWAGIWFMCVGCVCVGWAAMGACDGVWVMGCVVCEGVGWDGGGLRCWSRDGVEAAVVVGLRW